MSLYVLKKGLQHSNLIRWEHGKLSSIYSVTILFDKKRGKSPNLGFSPARIQCSGGIEKTPKLFADFMQQQSQNSSERCISKESTTKSYRFAVLSKIKQKLSFNCLLLSQITRLRILNIRTKLFRNTGSKLSTF